MGIHLAPNKSYSFIRVEFNFSLNIIITYLENPTLVCRLYKICDLRITSPRDIPIVLVKGSFNFHSKDNVMS